MFRDLLFSIAIAAISLSTLGLTAAPVQPFDSSPGSQIRANSPDDTSPTPEEILLAAGVILTPQAMQGVLEDAERPVELRYWAAIALGRTGEPGALEPLAVALGAEDPDLRHGAVVGLGELRNGAEALAPALYDLEAGIRAAAVQSLGRLAGPAARRLLIEKLRDADEPRDEIRLTAAFELGRLGGREVEPALRGALDDGSAQIRTAAALGLARRGIDAAMSVLVEAALDPLTEEWLRVDAIAAVERMSGESFDYVKPYSAPTTAAERAAALVSIDSWWNAHRDLYR